MRYYVDQLIIDYCADRNVIDPRNSEEHHLGIQGCKACAKLQEKDQQITTLL